MATTTALDRLRAELLAIKAKHGGCDDEDVIQSLADRLLLAAEWIWGTDETVTDDVEEFLDELAGGAE